MKTILVLTDFSIRADHATHYALKLARKIKANILLCNVFLVPSSTPMATQVAWPIENYGDLEIDSANDLDATIHHLNKELDKEAFGKDGFRPNIAHCSKTGLISDAIDEIISNHHIAMVIIGTHAKLGLGSFLSGDHVRDVIAKAHCPVMLVPEQAMFHDFKKIAFATDLSQTDIDVLHSLSGLARKFNAEILLTHIADESVAQQEGEPAARIFLTMVSSQLNYPKIYYRAVKGDNINHSLNWITEHLDIDLLVMVHRKKGFFKGLFSRSVTQKMADHLTKPLLIFPCSKNGDILAVFNRSEILYKKPVDIGQRAFII